MKAAVLFLALIGPAIAFQYPIQYEYEYEGRLATAVPGLIPQVSATGIKCNLVVQMKTKTQAIAQATDIQIGTYLGNDTCVQLRDPVHLKWLESRSSILSNLLEEPFGINFANEVGHVMSVTKADSEFIVNIRKAMIESLRIQPMIEDLSGVMKDHMSRHPSRRDDAQVYSLLEETLFGRCESQYTITKVPLDWEKQVRQDIAQTLRKDEQAKGSPRSGKSTLPELQDDLWRVMRSVNFDKCHDKVVLQHAGVSNMTNSAYAQMEVVQSRSSIGTYILRGASKNYRLERAIVEGDIIVNPFGSKEDRVQSISNQTMRLTSTGAIITPLSLPESTRNVKTWRYEVASPFSTPSESPKPWVNYYNKNDKYSPVPLTSSILGMFTEPDDRQKYKDDIIILLDSIVNDTETISIPTVHVPLDRMTGFNAATKIYEASKLMSALTKKDIESIFHQVFQEQNEMGFKKQMLLIDLSAASGASSPMKVLLDRMVNGRISNERIVSIFMTLTNSLVSPAVIPDILKYAVSVDVERTPLLASAVMINTASIVNRLCLNHMSYNYSIPHPIYGNMGCNNVEIITSFLPFLEQKVKNSPELWQKAIALEAISTMGTVHALPIMKKYIKDISAPEELRRIAIYAMKQNRMSSKLRKEVFDCLMGLVDNLEEKAPLRQSAFVVLLTWHPDAAWWQRMARNTWREPSQSFAAFFTFTVQSLAKSTDVYLHKQAEYAAFALQLLKPYAPSMQYSYNYIYSRLDPITKMKIFSEVAYIDALESILPSEIYALLRSSYGGFNIKLFEFSASLSNVQSQIVDILNLIRQQESFEERRSSNPRNPRDSSSHSSSQFFDKMDALGKEDKETIKPYVNVLVRTFDNINAFIPITAETIRKIAGPNCQDLIDRLIEGEKLNMTKYANLMKVEYFLPTDIGIPVVGELSLPTINLAEIEFKLVVEGKQSRVTFRDLLEAKTMHLMFKLNYRLMSKLKMSLRALMPFTNVIVESGVESYKEINLPFWGNLTLVNTDEVKNLTLNVAPYLPEFPVVYGHNIPFIAIRPLFQSRGGKKKNYRPIMLSDHQTPLVFKNDVSESKYTGIKSNIKYEADIEYPFTAAHFLTYMKRPELFMKLLASPTSKHWKLALIMLPRESSTKNISLSLSYLTPHINSTQQSKKIVPDFSPLDSIEQRLEKIRNYVPGHQVRAIAAQLVFNSSSVYKKYDSLVVVSKTEESDTKSYKTMMALMATIPEFLPQESLCFDVAMSTPSIKTYKRLQEALQQDKMHEELNAELYYGKSCTASPAISAVKAKISISDQRKMNVTRELDTSCNVDARHPILDFRVPAIYDKINVDLTYKEKSIPRHLMNAIYIVEKMIEGYMFPLVSFNRMLNASNKPDTIFIEGHRPIYSNFFSFHVQKPKETVTIELVNIPNYVSQIVPFYGLEDKSSKDISFLLAAGENEAVCKIESKYIVTFDRGQYDVTPIHCYTTVVTDTSSNNNWALYTRVDNNSNFFARLNIKNQKVEVIIQQDQAFVNNKLIPITHKSYDVKGKAGRTIVQIVKHSNSYEMNYLGYFNSTVDQQFRVFPSTGLQNMVSGLCGNFDGNPRNDRVGPKGCLYEDIELLKYSWSIKEGKLCDEKKYDKMQKTVVDYQEDCPIPNQMRKSLDVGNLNLNKKEETCTKNVYLIASNGHKDDLCVTIGAQEHCVAPCVPRHSSIAMHPSLCWRKNHIPEEMRKAKKIGYITHPVIPRADYVMMVKYKKNEGCHIKH